MNNATIIDVSKIPDIFSDEDNDLNTTPPSETEEDINNMETIEMTIKEETIEEEKNDDDSLVINFHFIQQDDKV